ncbi:MAG: cupin domain-containing protein [Deltaproteobacteria bacterium]|nr:cupin domain-containing protein [Deltaproteobacteria bacterium]MDQ3297686.1 cupin domain-containing protein [Myxococcota bacterium]
MSLFKTKLSLPMVAVCVIAGAAGATPSLGVTSQIFSRVALAPSHATGEDGKGWEVELKTKGLSDVVTQKIVIQPGGHAGWHGHPGAHFGSVQTGTLTLYDADHCEPHVYPTGTGFIDSAGGHHIARNEGTTPVELWVTYVLPHGSTLRTDMPAACGF